MKKAERLKRARMRALEYAQSGDYADGHAVEIAVRGEYELRAMRFSRFEMQEYDEMCRQARGEYDE